MPKFDDFDLDVNSNKNVKEDGAQTRIATSYMLCTPGTCNKDCKATAWFCSIGILMIIFLQWK